MPSEIVKNGICIDPSLGRGPSHGIYGLRLMVLVGWWNRRKDGRMGWNRWERTCANSEIKSPIVKAWRMLRIPIARFPMGSIPRCRRWRRFLQVSPRLSVEPSTCFRVNRVDVFFFVALELLSFSMSYLFDCEEYLCILVGFLPSARHAIVCILFSLEKSRVVHWVGAEFFLQHLLQESNYSKSEFIQPSLLCRCAPGRSGRKIWCGVLSIQCQIMTSCIHHKRTIVRVSWDGLPVGLLNYLLRMHGSASFVFRVVDQVLRFFAELADPFRLSQALNERFFVLVDLELLEQPLDFVFAYCILQLDCRKKYSSFYGVVPSFPETFRVAWWLPRWSCVLVLWILHADHIANTILTRLVTHLKLSELSGRTHP